MLDLVGNFSVWRGEGWESRVIPLAPRPAVAARRLRGATEMRRRGSVTRR